MVSRGVALHEPGELQLLFYVIGERAQRHVDETKHHTFHHFIRTTAVGRAGWYRCFKRHLPAKPLGGADSQHKETACGGRRRRAGWLADMEKSAFTGRRACFRLLVKRECRLCWQAQGLPLTVHHQPRRHLHLRDCSAIVEERHKEPIRHPIANSVAQRPLVVMRGVLLHLQG